MSGEEDKEERIGKAGPVEMWGRRDEEVEEFREAVTNLKKAIWGEIGFVFKAVLRLFRKR